MDPNKPHQTANAKAPLTQTGVLYIMSIYA